MTEADFRNLVLVDAFPEDDTGDEIPDQLAADPRRWRIELGTLNSEAMADITAKNAEIQDCTLRKAGFPKLMRLKAERVELLDRQNTIAGRLRVAKRYETEMVERDRAQNEAAADARHRRRAASFDGTEGEQIRAHLKAIFDLLPALEAGPA